MSVPPSTNPDPQRPDLITGVPGFPSTGEPSVVPPVTPPPARSNGPATASLVLGIVSMLVSLVFVPAVIGFVLGVIGLKQSGRTTPPVGRGKAVAGLVLSVLSVILGAVLVVAIAASSPQTMADEALAGVGQGSSAPDETRSDDGDAAASDDEPAEAEPQHYDLSDFTPVDAAGWAAIAKNPEAADGDTVIVFAEVTQFDSATGTDTFRANVGADRPAAEYELETNTLLTGDAAVLDDVVVGDVLKLHAVVAGAYEYETQIGGGTTVPLLAVAQVENVGFADLSKDVKLGQTTRSEYGSLTISATVTNSGSTAFSYSFDVVAESKDGSTAYGSGTGFAENLKPGQKTTVSVEFFDEVPADAVFRLGSVDRYDY